MAILDKEKGVVVLRIVYAGAPMSGKTESIRALSTLLLGSKSEQQFYSPDAVNERTLYFDWLNYIGGYYKGYKIDCQIISVPGQQTLQSRRKLLLKMADAVIFVVDSQPEKLEAAAGYYKEMLPWLISTDGPPIGIVLQVNKRDIENAISLETISEKLVNNDPNVLIMETVATQSSGIREAFVTGVRIGLDRVSWLIEHELMEIGSIDLNSGSELFTLIQNQEIAEHEALESKYLDEEDPEPDEIKLDLSGAQLHEYILQSNEEKEKKSEQITSNEKTVEHIIEESLASLTNIANAIDLEETQTTEQHAPNLPHKDITAGCVWPPVAGRIILHKISEAENQLKVQQSEQGDWYAEAGDQWKLLSYSDEVFSTANNARQHLIRYVQKYQQLNQKITEHRCVVVMETGNANEWRIWQIVQIEKNLLDLVRKALDQTTPKKISDGVCSLAKGLYNAHQEFNQLGLGIIINIENLSLHNEKVVFIDFLQLNEAVNLEKELMSYGQLVTLLFKQAIIDTLNQRTLQVPYILHHLQLFSRLHPEQERVVDMLKAFFIGEE